MSISDLCPRFSLRPKGRKWKKIREWGKSENLDISAPRVTRWCASKDGCTFSTSPSRSPVFDAFFVRPFPFFYFRAKNPPWTEGTLPTAPIAVTNESQKAKYRSEEPRLMKTSVLTSYHFFSCSHDAPMSLARFVRTWPSELSKKVPLSPDSAIQWEQLHCNYAFFLGLRVKTRERVRVNRDIGSADRVLVAYRRCRGVNCEYAAADTLSDISILPSRAQEDAFTATLSLGNGETSEGQ